MMTSSRSTSSLEWFFNSSSSANFPQVDGSPTLVGLQSDFARLADNFISAAALIQDSAAKDRFLLIGKDAIVLHARLRDGIDSTKANHLLSVLERMRLEVATLGSGQVFSQIWPLYRSTLASLILYAKDATDFQFKNGVLNLVRQSETQAVTQ